MVAKDNRIVIRASRGEWKIYEAMAKELNFVGRQRLAPMTRWVLREWAITMGIDVRRLEAEGRAEEAAALEEGQRG